MAKHTPGDWKVRWDHDGKSSPVYASEGLIVEPVCIIPHDDVTTEGMHEVEANGRLIAAAPVLLKAAKRLVSVAIEDQPQEWAEATLELELAIAKAEAR